MRSPRSPAGRLAAAVATAAFGTALLAGCSLGSASPAPSAARRATQAPGRLVSVTVLPQLAGTRLPPGFVGLSLEATTLVQDDFAHTNLAAYLRTLGAGGVIRIGGNTVDETFWTSTAQPPPRWSQGTITPRSLAFLAGTIAGTGWRVILGVNLKHPDPARSADEARYAHRILGPGLAAIEIGNEPDYYYRRESAYFAEFERYVRAIRAAVPGLALAGPDSAREDVRWPEAFARSEAPHPDVALLTAHNYPLSVCDGHRPTLAQLLSTGSVREEQRVASAVVAAARADRLPAVIDETNSVVCWGATGVSNVYGSALWVLDYALLLAEDGVTGADFHGKISGCNPYSPLCPAVAGGALTAQPEFYGLLALDQAGSGWFARLADADPAGVRAYAIETAPGRLSIVLDNVGPAVTVDVRVPQGHYSRARQAVLATSSPGGLSATGAISIGGRRIAGDGVFPAPAYTPVTVTAGSATVRLAAHTAAILKLS